MIKFSLILFSCLITNICLSQQKYNISYLQQPPSALGGIFISPSLGVSFPMLDFNENSKSALNAGLKLEFVSDKIYPVIIGGVFEYRSHPGNDDFKGINNLTGFSTSLTSFGGSIDLLLSKYFKSNFTIPFITIEAKIMQVKREFTPDTAVLPFAVEESKFAITGGLGFTLFIFDIYASYTHAAELSSIDLKTRFHFPIIRF